MAIEIVIKNGVFGQEYINGKSRYFVERGKDFDLTEVREDTDTQEVIYTVNCSSLSKRVEFVIPKNEAMDSRKLLEYVNDGLDVTGSNASIVPEVFALKEKEYIAQGKSINPVHSVAGVKETNDDSYVFAGAVNPLTGSEYMGHLNLEPSGNKEDWFDFVRQEIKGNVEIAFIISLAFAAILHSILQKHTDIDNFIVHIRGDSSSGKTTMLCLAASVFGAGTEKDPDGIISTWNATKNALLRRLMKVDGILMGLDEVSMNREKDFTGLLYAISSGIEKDRLTRDANVQARLVGRYLLLSTGEASLLAKTNGNIGLAMRVLEFDGHQWTKSAEQAEKIKRFVKGTYGHAATEFGLRLHDYILEHSLDALIKEFEDYRKLYCDRCGIQERKERMSGRYALILLGAKLSNDFFDFNIDINNLCDFIINNENDSAEGRNEYNDIFSKLISYIIINRGHFDDHTTKIIVSPTGRTSKEKEHYNADEPWGEFEDLKSEHVLNNEMISNKTVTITEVAFDKIVTKELGYEDPRTIRKFLKEKGLSVCESDRDFIRKIFRGVRTKMIKLYVPTDVVVSEDEMHKHARKEIKKHMSILKKFDDNTVFINRESIETLKNYEPYLSEDEMLKLNEFETKLKERTKSKLSRILEELNNEEDDED